MRSLAAAAAFALVFTGALYGGRAGIRALASAPSAQVDSVSAQSEAKQPRPHKPKQKGAKPRDATGRGREPTSAASLHAHDLKYRPNRRDNAIARSGVVRSSELLPEWRTGQQLAAPLRCRTNNPDLSHLTITGSAKSAFWLPRSSASISSSVQVFSSEGAAREYFELIATRAALGCMRRDIAKNLRTNGAGSEILSAQMITNVRIPGQVVAYTVVIVDKNHEVAWPVDVIFFKASRSTGTLVFQNVVNDKLNLAKSVVGRLLLGLRDT